MLQISPSSRPIGWKGNDFSVLKVVSNVYVVPTDHLENSD